MKLVFIIGSGAVGKMTVGQELMKRTGLRLFHNHMMIEPVLEIFGGWRGDVVSKLRRVILEEFVNSDQEGMIFTFMWAFDMPSDREYLLDVAKLFEDKGGEVYCVELAASQEIRLQRNRTENRLNNKA
ncbi:MAG: shikimate kinase, partial [Acetatifactor sp.]|nr:shikimate kinase [Acetatifactor sp.]